MVGKLLSIHISTGINVCYKGENQTKLAVQHTFAFKNKGGMDWRALTAIFLAAHIPTAHLKGLHRLRILTQAIKADPSPLHWWKSKAFRFHSKAFSHSHALLQIGALIPLISWREYKRQLCDSYLYLAMKYINYPRSFSAWKSWKETQELQYFLVLWSLTQQVSLLYIYRWQKREVPWSPPQTQQQWKKPKELRC